MSDAPTPRKRPLKIIEDNSPAFTPDVAEPPRPKYAMRGTESQPPPLPEKAPAEFIRDVKGHYMSAVHLSPPKHSRPPANLQTTPAPAAPNDVQRMMAETSARIEAGTPPMSIVSDRRRLRRLRDYLLIVIPTDLFFAGMMVFFPNPFTFVYGIAGIAIATAGTTWVYWVVMDRRQ